MVYYQGHSSPAYMQDHFFEGILTDSQLNNFRQEIDGGGLSSYLIHG